jgi:hypothetical protein
MLTHTLSTRFLPTQDQVTAHTYSASHMRSLVYASRAVDSLLESFSSPLEVLTGKATVEQGAGQTVVTVPYFTYSSLEVLSVNAVNALGQQLAVALARPVQLVLVRLLSPTLDASVLAQYLSKELEENTFRKTMLNLFTHIGPVPLSTSCPQPGTLIGVKVRLAGRLLKEASRPRQTIQSASLGSFSASPKHALQSGSYTISNSKGAYTVKVWLCVQC